MSEPTTTIPTRLFPPSDIIPIVTKIATILTKRNETISTSEAACGGLISSYLISVPGASNYYHGGTLVYSLKSRLKLSGWHENDIENYTGPSESVVLRLARNLKIEMGSDYTLSESGFAGPTGGDLLNQNPGKVYFGIVSSKKEMSKTWDSGSNNRGENMENFAKKALEFLLEFLEEVENSRN